MSNAAKVITHQVVEYIEVPEIDVSAIVTEDDTALDNFGSEKEQRLLTEPLYTSWKGPPPSPDPEAGQAPRTFIVAANVGVFPRPKDPAIVPDVFLSLDVEIAEDFWKKENRTYFLWEMGKPPDVVIEIVSNREGGELTTKRHKYARMRVPYYVVWDPQGLYGEPKLRTFMLQGDFYVAIETPSFSTIGLSLVAWQGTFEVVETEWLRWADLDGNLILTGAERAEVERKRAENESKRADAAQERAERLAAKLRALGIDPNAAD